MRLTNNMRAGILRAVVADLPPLCDHTTALNKRVRELNLAALPPAVRKIAEDPTLRAYLEAGSVYLYDYHVGSVSTIGIPNEERDTFHQTVQADPEVKRLALEQTAAREARDVATNKLTRDLDLCTTDVIFRARFPELSDYLPAEPAKAESQNLPATTATMDALRAAGWPTDIAA